MKTTSSRWLSGITTVLVGIVMCLVLVPATAPDARGVEVIGDDEQDRFVGSGAVIFPPAINGSVRRWASECRGCRWKATTPCQRDEEHHDAACRGFTLGCTQGREIQRAWVAAPGEDFQPVGLYCPEVGEVTSVATATDMVAGAFQHHVPALDPRCQPPTGVVVGIPVHCHSGQPAAVVRWSDQIAGMPVETTAYGSWEWRFPEAAAPGRVVQTGQPGRPYPDVGVQHTFWRPGRHDVEANAYWRGEFYVAGLGPFEIEQGLHQRGTVTVPTGSALGVIRP